jgi:hypothetical protein
VVEVLRAPVRLLDAVLRRVFGEPLDDESLALRDATERMEEVRRQIDRSHR